MGEKGSIIVFYMVLVEGDDMNELLVDEVCLLFDGYIVLFWWFVERGYYFVIDVLVMFSCVFLVVISYEYC